MSRNIIEDLIDGQATAYRGEAASADVRRRVGRRRMRNASLAGAGACVAVGAVAVTATQAGGWGRGFTPAAWAPAPNPYLADVNGDGQARVPLPTPPQPVLPPLVDQTVVDDLITCPAFPPTPTTQQGHAVVSLSQVIPGGTATYPVTESGLDVGVSSFDIATTTGAPTSIRVSQSRLYFVEDGLVVEVWSSMEASLPTSIDIHIGGNDYVATAGRFVRSLGGEHLTQSKTDLYEGSWPCGTIASDAAGPNLKNGHEYQVYLEVRVVADEQSAAQLHLLDEGVDLDSVTGDNGSLVSVATTGGETRQFEAIDVTFPAEYLQDQFDETLVSDPITIRIPDDWSDSN